MLPLETAIGAIEGVPNICKRAGDICVGGESGIGEEIADRGDQEGTRETDLDMRVT